MINSKQKIKYILGVFLVVVTIIFILPNKARAADSGSKKAGETCKAQTDCASGYYCEVGTFYNTCEKKIADGSMCTSGGFFPKLDNCKNGCSTSTYYNGVADSESGAVIYYCGAPSSSTSKKTTGTTASTTADGSISGTATGGGIVTCGRSGGTMCTLCDLIKGIYDIVNYLIKIAIGIAVLAICIGGVLYIVSAGDPGLIEMGKKAMKNAIIGFIVVFAAVLIIDTLILYLGAKSDLGISADWKSFSFNCTSTASTTKTDEKSTDTDKKTSDTSEKVTTSTEEWK